MSIQPILAEDLGGAFLVLGVFGLVLVSFGIASLVCIPVIAGHGKSTGWGLCLGLFFALGGGFLFFGSLANTGGGMPLFFKIAAVVPMLCGLLSLYLWGLDRKNWPATALRICLYGSIIVFGLWTFVLWVRQPH